MEKEPVQYFGEEQAENFKKDIPNLEDSVEYQKEKQREAFGRNVEVRAIFLHHAEREDGVKDEVPLTEKGVKESKKFGKGLDKKHRIEGEASLTSRTELTKEEIIGHSPTETKLKNKNREGLAFHCSDDFMDETIKHVEKN